MILHQNLLCCVCCTLSQVGACLHTLTLPEIIGARCKVSTAVSCRRDLLSLASGAGLTLLTEQPALAKLPKGFSGVRDTGDGYEFIFPFGWQEVSVSGVDSVYKDIIEPLESLSVQLTPTAKQSITDYGPANEIAGTLANSVLAKSTDEVQLIKSEAEQADGRYVINACCRTPKTR